MVGCHARSPFRFLVGCVGADCEQFPLGKSDTRLNVSGGGRSMALLLASYTARLDMRLNNSVGGSWMALLLVSYVSHYPLSHIYQP